MVDRRFFGTDGIRGTANLEPMTPDIALKVGMAAGSHFSHGDHRHKVVIGKDTRLSGYMIEASLMAGFLAVGIDVFLVGPMPTPAVAMLTRSMRADLGVMISASHNPFYDNGIKLFDRRGLKLSDIVEKDIERYILGEEPMKCAVSEKIGRAKRLDDAPGRYIEYVKHSFPRRRNLAGIKVVLDCANGAAYHLGETILWELEAEVIALGVRPNGFNINENCGAMHPHVMAKEVVRHQADIGIALDGDADRLVVCDETGKIIDGDQILALIATYQKKRGTLHGEGIVATDMSNMGLEDYLAKQGLILKRTAVGDRYVSNFMREHGFNVGGEQSGHIILRDYVTTGDGLVAALQVLAVLAETGRPASEILNVFRPYPQVLRNVRYTNTDPLEYETVKQAICEQEERLSGKGRLLIRKSGTEPMIRVMAEGRDKHFIQQVVHHICAVVESAV